MVQSIDLKTILSEGTREQRLSVIHELRDKDDEATLDILVSAFDNSFWFVRRDAADTLVSRGSGIIDTLVRRLATATDDQGYWIIYCLRALGPEAVHHIIAQISHPNHSIAVWAINTMGELRSDEAVRELVNCFGHPKWVVRRAASQAIERIGSPGTVTVLHETYLKNANVDGNEDICYWSIKLLGKMAGQKSVDTLLNLVKSPKEYIRFNAITALGETGVEKAIPALIDSLNDSSWLNRKHAAANVEKFGAKAIPALKDAFKNGNSDVRYWTIRVIGNILGTRAVEFFKSLMKSREKEIRYYVVSVAGGIRTEEAAALLLSAFKDDYWLIRSQAASLLIKKGSAIAPFMAKAIETGDEDIRYWSYQVLRALGGEGIRVILDHAGRVGDQDRYSIVCVLSGSEEPLVEGFMLERLSDRFWRVSNAACNHFIALEFPPVEKILDWAVKKGSGNEECLYWCLRCLSHHSEATIEAIDRRLETPIDEVEATQLKIIANRLSEIDEPSDLDRVSDLESMTSIKDVSEYLKDLNHRNDRVRLEAVIALGTVDDVEIIDKLRMKIQDSSEEVRTAALKAVKRFEGSGALPDQIDTDWTDEAVMIGEASQPGEPATSGWPRWKKLGILLIVFLIMAGEFVLVQRFLSSGPENIVLDMKHASALRKLGEVYQEKKDFDTAEKTYREALAKAPGYPNAFLDLGILSYRKNDLDAALEYLEKAEEFRGNDWDDYSSSRHITFLVMGNVLSKKRRFEDAVEKYRQSLKIKPDFKQARLGYDGVKGFVDFYMKSPSKSPEKTKSVEDDF